MTDAERKKKQNERQRRSRTIKRKDDLVVKITVSREKRDMLIENNRLGAWDENNVEIVRAVVQQIWDDGEFGHVVTGRG